LPQGIIQKITVEGLFGRYSHNIPEAGDLSSPVILYGDNGVGKSTILAMVFHLLSADGDKGHRTALRKIPFKRLSVALSNGTTLTAAKDDDFEDDGVLTLQVWQSDQLIAEWEQTGSSNRRYEDDHRFFFSRKILQQYKSSGLNDIPPELILELAGQGSSKVKNDNIKRGDKEYLNLLSSNAPAMFYLNADRRLDSDVVADPSEEVELRQVLAHRENKRATDVLKASRAISLKQALSNASRWVTRRAVRSANLGSENVHSVYEKVVEHLATDYLQENAMVEQRQIQQLQEELYKIERDAEMFAQYELTSKLSMDRFKLSLETGIPRSDAISAKLIGPYLKSLSSRLDAIRPVYDVLNDFVTTINEFLTRKKIQFKLAHGFIIIDNFGNTLDASQLSSGEQQLLLIFCYVLSARDTPSVFIIDEPEISLNVKWQRRMVESLMLVAEGSEIQFLFASHSMELISQHMDNVEVIQ
jgi:energy-coupling factor transporter ATP-binding protein EcfA2